MYQYSTKLWLDYWYHQVQLWYYKSNGWDRNAKAMLDEINHLIHASKHD